MATKNNRAARTRAAQQRGIVKVAMQEPAQPTLDAIKALIEQSKAPAPAVAPTPQPRVPVVVNIVYVFENGTVVAGTPATLKLIQNGAAIDLLNIVGPAEEGRFHPVATFHDSTLVVKAPPKV